MAGSFHDFEGYEVAFEIIQEMDEAAGGTEKVVD